MAGDDEEGRDADGEPDNAATPAKRQRVSRACDQCRAARERCDGKPQCHPCVSQNRSCTYQTNPKKRGVQTGYIRTLEVALAWVFERVPDSEAALHGLLARQGEEGRSLLAGSNTNRFHRKWRKSRVQKAIERVLSGDGAQGPPGESSPVSDDDSDTTGGAEHISKQISGQHPALDPSQYLPTSPISSTQDPQRRPPSSRGHHEPLIADPDSLSSARRRPKLPSNHWRLLDIYFSYTHSWLPILEKQDIFQALYRYSSENAAALSPEDPSAAVYAELWAALALASFQDAASHSQNVPGVGEEASLCPEEIYQTARNLIPPGDATCQAGHVRALLLLALVNLGRDNVRSAWFLVGTAVQAFLSATTEEHRGQPRLRAVLIACFILDTIISATYRKPSHLDAEELLAIVPIPESALDEWQPWTSCDGFGPASPPSLQSRNPAHCLSTFNQLYCLLAVTRRHPEAGVATSLQQAVQDPSPFRTFVLSPSLFPASVPSPYVLRAVYLWATSITTNAVDQTSHLILETIEQYVASFGICGAPAIFTSCLSLLAHHHTTSRSDHERLESLQAKLMATWGQGHQQRSHPEGSTGRIEAQATPRLAPEQRIQASPAVDSSHHFPAGASAVQTPTSFYSESSMLTPQPPAPSASHMFPTMQSSYIINPYQRAKPLASPSIARLTQEAAKNDRRASLSSPLSPMVESMHQHHPPLQAGFNAATMDYDALLDDLASIDYGDQIDADPQFMMNLGFAPDCDITEILTREFGVG
ncbi:hypothetical protein GQ53DRAFT_735224 [Thozetella sp. PMI_491]|nr:hypothetical protein GQ53DRAFT_735224 [Thozetella sp. PMI_491]